MKFILKAIVPRTIISIGLVMGLSLNVASIARATTNDSSSMRILVGFPAGGAIDTLARLLADEIGKELKQTIVVDNRSGGGGVIAAQTLKHAAPDGKTLMLTNDHTVAILPITLKTPGFNTKQDFAPIAIVMKAHVGLAVNARESITDLKNIHAWKNTNKRPLNIGVSSPGGVTEFAVGVIGKSLEVEANAIPYRGASPMLADLVGGQVPFGITSTIELRPFLEAKKLRLLAVAGTARQPNYPDVPTFAELGIPRLTEPVIAGLYAPAGTPQEIINKYEAAVQRVTLSKDFLQRATDAGFSIEFGDRNALASTVDRIQKHWAPILQNK